MPRSNRSSSLRLALLSLTVLALLTGLAGVPASASGVDVTPPVITTALNRTLLWPPLRMLLPVGFNASALDDCDGGVEVTVRVFSDEPAGAAPYAPDAIANDLTTGGAIAIAMRLRAERAYPGDGRVYMITSAATDAAGNIGVACDSVLVPAIPVGASILSAQAQAAAGAALCMANDGLMPGWNLLLTITITLPINARDDAYDSIGNTRLDVPAASGVLANDAGAGITVIAFDALSANGGDVAVAANGGFTYDPAPGFNGTDTFNYTAQAGGFTDSATVTVTVDEMIWYIDNAAAAGGDGRQATPFDALADMGPAADVAGDVIYVDRGLGTTANYNTGITLLANQELYGEGVSLAANVSFPIPTFNTLPGVGTRPLIANTTGAAITTPGGNTIRGLDIDTSTVGTGISASGAGLTVSDVTITGPGTDGITFVSVSGTVDIDNVDVANPGGQGFNLSACTGSFDFDSACSVSNAFGTDFRVSGGTCAVTYNGDLSQPGAGGLVTVAGNHTTGTVLFQTGAIGCTSGSGLRLGPCSSTTTFSNAMSLATSTDAIILQNATGTTNFTNLTITASGEGIASSGGGTLNVTGTNSITATGDSALDLSSAALNMTFSSLTCTSGSNGIRVSSCTGTLSVTGLTDVNSPTGDGILIGTSPAIDLDFGTIDIDGGGADGIDISGGVGDFDVAGQTTIDGTSGTGIRIATSASDTFTFADTDVGLTTACPSGVSLTSSAGATFTFADLDITSSAGAGLVCDTAGTLNIAGSPAINATGGAAIDITDTNGSTNGTGNFEFAAPVSTDSPTVGIRFETTSEIVLLTDVDIDSSSTAIANGIEFTDCTGTSKTVRRGHIVFTGTNNANGVFVDNSDDVTIEGDTTSAFDPIGIPNVFTGAFEITGMGTGSTNVTVNGNTHGHHAVLCHDANGLTVDRCYIHDIGDVGNTDASLDAGVYIDETTAGTVNITNNHFEDIIEADAFHLGSSASTFTGTSTFNFTFNRVVGDPSNVGATTTEAGVQAAIKSTAGGTVIGNFDDNAFEGCRIAINVQVDAGNPGNDGNSGTGAGGRNDFSASDNQIEDMDLLGIAFDLGDDSVSRIIVDDNVIDASVNHTTFDTGPDQPIEIEIRNDDAEAPIVDAFVRDNTIRKTNAGGPIWTGSGIKVETAGNCTTSPVGCGAGRIRCMISGNDIGSIDDEGIEVQADEGNTLEGIIRLNDVDHLTTVGSTLGGIDLDLQGSTDPATMRVWLDDNDSGADSLGYDINEPAGPQIMELAGESSPPVPLTVPSTITTNADLVAWLNHNGNSSDNGGTSKVDGTAGSVDIVTTASVTGPSLMAARKARSAADYIGRTLGHREELAAVLEAAKARWIAAGIRRNERRVLESITLEVARLEDSQLAKSWFTHIVVDPDAAGFGWFVDASPESDQEFGKDLRAATRSEASGSMDLLTVLMHEIGHVLGREHCSCPGHVMTHDLVPGVRRLPAAQKRR